MSGRHRVPGWNCQNCGHQFRAKPYDIGSGPEVSCPNCQWCWGANGQSLQPLPLNSLPLLEATGAPVPDWMRQGQHVGTLFFDRPPE